MRQESEKPLRFMTETCRVMSTRTSSGRRLVEWAELVDESVPEELRKPEDAER